MNRLIAVAVLMLVSILSVSAQNSVPEPVAPQAVARSQDGWCELISSSAYYWSRGKPDDSERYLKQAAFVAEELGDSALKNLSAVYLARFYRKRGRGTEAVAVLIGAPGANVADADLSIWDGLAASYRDVNDAERAVGADAQARAVRDRLPNIDYKQYMGDLQKAIKEKWEPLSNRFRPSCRVDFRISPDGTISLVRIGESSAFLDFDRQSMDTVRKVGKAGPLPEGSREPVNINFSFAFDRDVTRIPTLRP